MAAGYGLVIKLNPPAAVDNEEVRLTVPCTIVPIALKVVALEGSGIGLGATLVLNRLMFMDLSPLKNKKYPVDAFNVPFVLAIEA